MAGLALVVALASLVWAVLDIRAATLLVVVSAVLVVVALTRGHLVWLGQVALIVTVLAAGLTAWETWELRRPTPDVGPVPTQRADPGPDREVLLPLTVERAPIPALALLEFAEGQDRVYEGLEPQIVDRGDERGIRIIAYRHDGHTDFYDDLALRPDPGVSSAVTGKGLANYRHTDLGNPLFQVEDGRLRVEFAFDDVEGRRITGVIREHTDRRSVPLGLLAPVGLSSTDPEYFPLFLLHRFEFVRTGGTEIDLRIDDHPVRLAQFPVPLPVQGQRRSFAKYTPEAELYTVFPTDSAELRQVRTDGDTYVEDDVTYLFDGGALERIVAGGTEIVWTPPLDVTRGGEGRLAMVSHPEMGRVAGAYRVGAGGVTRLEVDLDEVDVPRQRGLLYSAIINRRSMFGTWPTAYRYTATFDPAAGTVTAEWVNEKPGG